MRSQTRFVSLALVALLALVGLAACGEEDEEPIVEDVTRVAVEGAPPELPTPDEAALTAEAATAQAEQAGGQPGGQPGGGTPAGGQQAGAAVRLEAYDLGWRTPDQPGPQVNLTVAPGGTIELVNAGAAEHDFSVDDLGIDVDMPVGFSGSATIPAGTAPGDYSFICDIPGHAAIMFGTLTVDPNAAAAGPPPGGGDATAGGQQGGGQADAAVAQTTKLEGYDIGWRTADQPGPQVQLTVVPGGTIELVNAGAAEHDFSVDDLGIDVDMPVGFTGSVTIPENTPPGDYKFICDIPGHGAIMFGTLTVQ